MNFFSLVWRAAMINLTTLRARLGAAAVVVVGIGGVVGVLVTVLALGGGLERTLAATGRPDRAIVTAKGAFSESASAIQHDGAYVVAVSPAIAKTNSGKPLLSMEMLTQIQVAGSKGAGNVTLRGVGPLGMTLRPEIRITSGRMFQAGRHEAIVGDALQSQFPGLRTGGRVMIQNSRWDIVGSFAGTSGGIHDSELFGDAATLMSAFHRTNFQSITVRLTNPGALAVLSKALSSNPSLAVDAEHEDKYYAKQSIGIIKLLTAVAYSVGGIMALGAVFAALNTMYAAVASQGVTIATLRAIGFSGSAVLAAVLVEALTLAVVGALVGAATAWLLFSGHTLSMFAGGGQAIFQLRITGRLVLLGVVWALAIGLIGGLFPAIRAARLPVATALRPE
jgi:putative ABC transport system permease protein